MCFGAYSFRFPFFENISLVPLGEARQISNVFELDSLPSEPLNISVGPGGSVLITPSAYGYEFKNNALLSITNISSSNGKARGSGLALLHSKLQCKFS